MMICLPSQWLSRLSDTVGYALSQGYRILSCLSDHRENPIPAIWYQRVSPYCRAIWYQRVNHYPGYQIPNGKVPIPAICYQRGKGKVCPGYRILLKGKTISHLSDTQMGKVYPTYQIPNGKSLSHLSDTQGYALLQGYMIPKGMPCPRATW